jgi:hypothetical protein
MMLVISDLYLSDDFAGLQEHLHDVLGRSPSETDPVDEFFRQASSPLASRAWTEVTSLTSQQVSGMYRFQHYPGLPPDVEWAHVNLHRPAAGIASLTVSLTMRSADAGVVSALIAADHPRKVIRTKAGETFYMVREAKKEALARQYLGLTNLGLFPRERGLLKGKPYPGGALCVYGQSPVPSGLDKEWRDTYAVLGADVLEQFRSGTGDTIMRGVPVVSDWPSHDRQGMSLFMGAAAWEACLDATSGGVYLHYEESLIAMLPWVVLIGAMDGIADQAAGVRQFLEKYRYSATHYLRNRSLDKRVDELDRLDYKLKRITAFTQAYRDETGVPTMLYVDPLVSLKLPAGPETKLPPRPETPSAPARATAERHDLKQGLVGLADELVRRAAADVEMSLNRAQHLLQMRTNSALLRWASITAVFTLLAAVAAIVAVVFH